MASTLLVSSIACISFTESRVVLAGFSYPVVPKGKARIRVQISAALDFDQVDRAVAAFKEVRDLLCPDGIKPDAE